MKSRYHISTMIMLLTCVITQAQDQSQALRVSENFLTGTAKYAAMGGALGAIGGDFTSVSANPAGLGLYRSSEFTITPTYTISRSTTNLTGDNIGDHVSKLSISNLGLVSSLTSKKEQGLVGVNLAFGYNTLSDLHNSFTIQGTNSNSSLLDNFIMYANSTGSFDPFYEQLAWDTYVMLEDSISGDYIHYLQPYPSINYDGYGQEQYRIVERSGQIGEYAFSAALNISHKLYLGGTLGIHAVRYYEDIEHIEEDLLDLEPEFESFRFNEYNSTRGYGYVLKLGIIYKPIHILRLGASFHAPVKYFLVDQKYTSMSSTWDSSTGYLDEYSSSDQFFKEYTVSTPMRASLSAAVLIGKLGMISAEYEFVDYSTAEMWSRDYNFLDENKLIAQDFQSAQNLKLGAEFRLKALSIRGGAQMYSSPFSDGRNRSTTMVYSGGLGYSFGKNYLDFAYVLRTYSDVYQMYTYLNGNMDEVPLNTSNNYNVGKFMVTLGYKF